MFTYILYALAIIALAVSFFKDRKKTKAALMKAWKSFENILPQILTIFLVIGFALAIFPPETIRKDAHSHTRRELSKVPRAGAGGSARAGRSQLKPVRGPRDG